MADPKTEITQQYGVPNHRIIVLFGDKKEGHVLVLEKTPQELNECAEYLKKDYSIEVIRDEQTAAFSEEHKIACAKIPAADLNRPNAHLGIGFPPEERELGGSFSYNPFEDPDALKNALTKLEVLVKEGQGRSH